MSISIAQVNTAVENFLSWVNKHNLVTNVISTAAVTAEPLANGSLTTGNAYVNGIMAVVELATTVIRPGNVQATGTLAITANTLVLGNSTVNVHSNSTYLYAATFQSGNSTVGVKANTSALLLNGKTYTNLDPYIAVQNSGAAIGTRPTLNFISSSSATVDVVENVAQNRIDLTISASSPENINALTITVGNSTINSFINSTFGRITSIQAVNVAVNTFIWVGNSTVNAQINSSTFFAPVLLTGNTTVGFQANISHIRLNGTSYTNLDPHIAIQNTGAAIGDRPTLNFISGTSTDVDVVDNAGQNRVDVTISINSAALSLGVIGGANTHVQYNDEGAFNGSAGFTFNETTNTVAVGNTITVPQIFTPNVNANNILQWQAKHDTLYVNVAVTTAITIDSFPFTDYRSAEYLLSIKDNNANAYQLSKILVIHDGGAAYLTEYGVLTTNGTIAVMTGAQNATHAFLNYTAAGTNNTSIKIARTLINP